MLGSRRRGGFFKLLKRIPTPARGCVDLPTTHTGESSSPTVRRTPACQRRAPDLLE
jgi:hypothetical protein